MAGRTERFLKIRELIEKNNIDNQEDLLKLLRHSGFNCTQATLSRDMKTLRIAKMPDNKGGYRLVQPENFFKKEITRPSEVHSENIITLLFSENIGIMKTYPGHASGIASYLDSLNIYEIAGTLAGDDTLLFIIREGFSQADVKRAFRIKMPQVRRFL
jgi:transcriptional regulator of arginine metabolism